FEVDPANAADYSTLVDALSADDTLAFRQIAFAWPLSAPDDDALGRGVYPMLHLCQALTRLKLDGKLQLVYVHNARAGAAAPEHEAIAGFFRSLHLEFPKLQCKALEVPADFAALAASLWTELGAAGDVAVRYAPDREVRRLKWFDLAAASDAPAALRER